MGAEIYVLTIPTAKNKEFIAKFHKDKGYYPTWLRGKAYTATLFWAEAVKKAGKTDVAAVIKAWEGLTYDGPAGTLDHAGLRPPGAGPVLGGGDS